MTDDAQLIKAALDRRFSRADTPACPDGAFRAATTTPGATARPRSLSRRFAYAAALLGVVAIGGLAAQASSSGKLHDLPFMTLFVSSKPLQPMIHRADRLTVAEAQRRMPFEIVIPAGLPAGTKFLYAHVISEHPIPHVALTYQAHIANRYYRIAVSESTAAIGPPRTHFEVRSPSGTKAWDLPVRRWKHGDIVMQLPGWGLPAEMSDRIVRANTL
jgi:hypothetical protein